MNKKLFFLSLLFYLFPLTSLAAFDVGARPVVDPTIADPIIGNAMLLTILTGLFTFLWILFLGFAIMMFIIAGFQFFSAQGDPAEIAKIRKFIIWGIVGIVVAIIAFELPFIIRDFFVSAPPDVPAP